MRLEVLSYLLSITKFDRSVLLYMLAWSMIGFVHLGIYLVLTNLYILKLGFDVSYVGILNGSGQITWAIFALPAGMIGARFGLRNSLVAGFALVSFGMAGFLGIAWLPQPAWTSGLLLSNAFTWIGAAVVVVNGSPYLMAITPEKDRTKAFTLQAALFTLAAFLGSLMAGMLPDFFLGRFPGVLTEAEAYNMVLWLSVPAYLASAVLLLKVRKEPAIVKEYSNGLKLAAPVGLLIFLGILFGLQLGSEAAVASYINVYFATDLKLSNSIIGTIFASARLLPFFLSPILPLVLNRWGSGRTMAAGSLIMAGLAMVIAFIPNGLVAGAGFMLFIMISSFGSTARTLFGQESVHPRWRTTVMAVLTISMALGGGLMGFTAGRLIALAGFQALFLTSAILSLLAAALFTARGVLGFKNAVPISEEAIPDQEIMPADEALPL
jgi:MFS family permease